MGYVLDVVCLMAAWFAMLLVGRHARGRALRRAQRHASAGADKDSPAPAFPPPKKVAAQSVLRAAAPVFVPSAQRVGYESTHGVATDKEQEMEE